MSQHSPHPQSPHEIVSFGAGAPLALAHGAGGSIRDNFEPLAEHLPHRTLLGPNYPGSGGSPDPTEPLRLDDLADAVVASAVDAGFEQFPVLGLSLGSAVAITAAHRHPDRVTGLVLTVGLDAIDAQGVVFAALYSSLARAGRIHDLARFLHLGSEPSALAAMTPADAEQQVDRIAAAHVEAAPRRAPQMDLVSTVDVRALVPQIDVPVLTVVAGQDRVLLPQTTHRLGSTFTDGEVVELPGAGHTLIGPHLRAWAEHVGRFLSSRAL